MSSNGWQDLKLGDVCIKITDGAHFSPKENPSGLPMASVKDLTRYGIDLSACKRISEEDFNNLVKQGCAPQRGDVLIAKDGNTSLDTVCVFNQQDRVVLLSSIAILRPNEKVTSDFLNYYFDNCETRNYLKENFRSGSAIPRVILRDFRNAPIRIPPIKIQKRIGNILRSIDDKIALNNQTNQTLEAIAQGLFKEWFVNFNFPGATGEMQKSVMGEIPKGWRVGCIEDLFELQRGFDLPSNIRIDGVFPVIAASGINGYHNKYKIEAPGVTTGRSGVLGKVFYIQEDFWPLNTSLYVKRYKGATPLFSYHILRKIDLEKMNGGSAVPTLNRNDVHKVEIVIPSKELIYLFESTTAPLYQKIKSNEDENKTLTQLRDTLLPKLMKGELTITETEKLTSEVL